MYSPAERPSSIRAAPAKKRIWSTIGGISSVRVSPIGLPVFSHSAAISSSARSSKRVRDLQQGLLALGRAWCRARPGKAAAAAAMAASTSACAGQRRGGVRLAGRGVDHLGGPPVGGVPELPVDVVAQTTQLGGHCAPLLVRCPMAETSTLAAGRHAFNTPATAGTTESVRSRPLNNEFHRFGVARQTSLVHSERRGQSQRRLQDREPERHRRSTPSPSRSSSSSRRTGAVRTPRSARPSASPRRPYGSASRSCSTRA